MAGMELTTAEDIHMICLFEELENAMAFDKEVAKHLTQIQNRPEIFGNQLILNEQDEPVGEVETLLISATDLPINEAIDLARQYGAHVHPAHIDRESNGIVSILGCIPEEYDFHYFELNDKQNLCEYESYLSQRYKANTLFCSDAHHLWDISEADHSLMLDDEPYSSALVRERLFELLSK